MSDWHCLCRMHPTAPTRSGALARICSLFADRGISIGEVHAHTRDAQPTIELTFSAGEAMAQHLVRRLRRLPDIRQVELTPR
jgi:predicted regulator of amino acid metabolism with ACT domain